ncbi:MAG: class F sortase [Candidatus Moranbacteria bacterium]|nr:class F sortase [Candidatus Moranbacteria bacterium]
MIEMRKWTLILALFILVCSLGLSEEAVSISTIPTHITIPTIGVDADILEYTNEQVSEDGGVVNPDYMDKVAWWSGGGTPGFTADEIVDNPETIDFTVFFYGHSSNNDDRKVVFDDLDLLRIGDQIFLSMESEEFIYSIEDVFIISKADFTSDSRVLTDSPGRLLLISCWRSWSGAAPTTDNVVVIAELVVN